MNERDSELRELEKIRDELVRRALEVRDELQNPKKKIGRDQRVPVGNLTTFVDTSNGNDDSTVTKKSSARLCEALESVLGVQFKNVQKSLSHDNVYRYNADVVTKATEFSLELVVNVKDHGENNIEDIKCHFTNLSQSYLQEITPWVQEFEKNKHFSYLISALSDYSDQSIIRAKILSTIKSNGYLTVEKCEDNGGGILIFVHPPKAEDRIFFKIQWYTRFVAKTWRIEHIFAIDAVQADEEFIKRHEKLLQSFCRIGLKKEDLEELWNKLCIAIDNDKQ